MQWRTPYIVDSNDLKFTKNSSFFSSSTKAHLIKDNAFIFVCNKKSKNLEIPKISHQSKLAKQKRYIKKKNAWYFCKKKNIMASSTPLPNCSSAAVEPGVTVVTFEILFFFFSFLLIMSFIRITTYQQWKTCCF